MVSSCYNDLHYFVAVRSDITKWKQRVVCRPQASCTSVFAEPWSAHCTRNICDLYPSNYSKLYKTRYECSFLTINLTTCSSVQSFDEVDTIRFICCTTDIIWDVGFWFALVAGLVGNGLAIFTIASLPKSTSTFYVGLLAVSDILALCVRGTVIILTEEGLMTTVPEYANLIGMFFDFCPSYSNWLLVLICLERFLTVRFPLQKRSILTLRRAQLSALVLALALLLAYSLALSTLNYSTPDVFGVKNMLYAVLPLGLVFTIIVLISCQLRHVQRSRKKIMRSHSSPRSLLASTPSTTLVPASRQNSIANVAPGTPASHMVVPPQRSPTTLQDIARLENSITVMMLVAAVCFFLLTMPYCVVLYAYKDSTRAWANAPISRARWYLLRNVSLLLTLLNLSVNFILYFLSAKKFRSQLYRVLTPKSLSARGWNMTGPGCTANYNYNNNNSQNNSAFACRAMPLGGDSETSADNILLRCMIKAMSSNSGAASTVAAAAAAAAADVDQSADSAAASDPAAMTIIDNFDTSDEESRKPTDPCSSSDLDRCKDSERSELLTGNSVISPCVSQNEGRRTSICNSSGPGTAGTAPTQDQQLVMTTVVEIPGHSGTQL
ncbi:thyrotropin-releasing hormone receptor-like protein [Plakobranchus ocellatus]|uniref:Thyrotropin-releasing hormone receptor-like protein n=1 Tax=Plakobranchus ocellatus TaxID=259542 RepID=A0AAV4BWK4_9GAST|nr:thyrotropin-releasing hormone receptor-like protein [Plakobranchus ocellatus]